MGRGKLNNFSKLLIYGVKIDFYFQLEYQLEYRSVENCFAQDYSEFPVEDRVGKKWSLPVMSRIFIYGKRLCSRRLRSRSVSLWRRSPAHDQLGAGPQSGGNPSV